ncbi:MAG: hypothetical protein M0Z95_04425 [Actinomycetota bacterium]|nr:hypothetical protein [Actinomycetota bacterium]
MTPEQRAEIERRDRSAVHGDEDSPECMQAVRDRRALLDALVMAETEAARLREQLEATDARLAAAEEEIGRLREAIGDHGRCWCHHYPGYPRGALEGQRIEEGDR